MQHAVCESEFLELNNDLLVAPHFSENDRKLCVSSELISHARKESHDHDDIILNHESMTF